MISTDNGAIRNAFGDMEALRMIHEAGFDGVDYTFYDMVPEYDILHLPDAQRYALAMELRDYAEKVGMKFPQSHAPYALRCDEGFSGDNYETLLKSMEFTSWLGCKQIVVHTLKYPRESTNISSNEKNRAFLRGLLPYAEKYDIDIGVENLFIPDAKRKCFFGQHATPEELNAFIDSLGSQRFKACCDLGHAAITGIEPEDFIAAMDARRMTMVHIHDTDYRGDRHWLPYMGKQRWEAITKALAAIGFEGSINLEVLHFYEMFPAELLQAALHMAAETARHLEKQMESQKKK